jgi:hypothetical protein
MMIKKPMLSGSLVIAAWSALWLWVEEMAFTYVNILNKQSWTANRGVPLQLGCWVGSSPTCDLQLARQQDA